MEERRTETTFPRTISQQCRVAPLTYHSRCSEVVKPHEQDGQANYEIGKPTQLFVFPGHLEKTLSEEIEEVIVDRRDEQEHYTHILDISRLEVADR